MLILPTGLALPRFHARYRASFVRPRYHVLQRTKQTYLPFFAFSSFPKADILRTLDAMSYVKATTFHWHVVDSQSFPLVVAKFPELSAKGAYSVRFCMLRNLNKFKLLVCMKQASQVYTAADVKDIVAYAGAVSETELNRSMVQFLTLIRTAI